MRSMATQSARTTGTRLARAAIGFLWVMLVMAMIDASRHDAAAQQCPRGQITCGQFCELEKDNPNECKYGATKSCVSRFGNVNHCIGRGADNLGREDERGNRRGRSGDSGGGGNGGGSQCSANFNCGAGPTPSCYFRIFNNNGSSTLKVSAGGRRTMYGLHRGQTYCTSRDGFPDSYCQRRPINMNCN